MIAAVGSPRADAVLHPAVTAVSNVLTIEDPVLEEHAFLFFGNVAKILPVRCCSRVVVGSAPRAQLRVRRAAMCVQALGADTVASFVDMVLSVVTQSDGIVLEGDDDDDLPFGAAEDDSDDDAADDDDEGGDDGAAGDDDDEDEDDPADSGRDPRLLNVRIRSVYLDSKVVLAAVTSASASRCDVAAGVVAAAQAAGLLALSQILDGCGHVLDEERILHSLEVTNHLASHFYKDIRRCVVLVIDYGVR